MLAALYVILESARGVASLSTGSLTMISTRADGTSGPALPSTFGADQEAISDDGKVIAFVSPIPADQLVTDPLQIGHVTDTNGVADVFVWDSRVPAPAGPIVSLASWNNTHTGTGDAASQHPIMAPAGVGIVFESSADDLVTVPVGSSSNHLYAWLPLISSIFPVFMVDENYTGTAGANSVGRDASIAVTAVPPAARIAYTSTATDLVDPAVHDSHGFDQVYVRTYTLAPPSTEMVSVGTDGNGTVSGARDPMISASGIDVAFSSGGSGLVSGVNATSGDIFVRNLLTDTTTLVSNAQGSSQGTSGNADPVISADGGTIAWDGNDPNLSPTPHNGNNHIFYRVGAGPVQMVDTDFTGLIGCNQASNNPGLSLDGTVVVFESFCTDIAPPSIAENSGTNVFERRMSAVPSLPDPAPQLVSSNDAGTGTGNASSFLCPGNSPPNCGASTNAGMTVNADGTAIAFFSDANDIGTPPGGVPPFSNGNVFVRYPDLTGGGKTVNLSVNGGGTNPDGVSRDPVISSDGGSAAFVSLADDLVTPDTNQATDVFESDMHNSFYIQPIAAVGEGAGSVTITVGRTGNDGTTDTVKVDTGDGSIPALPLLPPEITDPADSNAVAPGDYTSTSKTLKFAPGVLTQSFSVPINDDLIAESPELFHVALSTGTGAGTVPLPGPLSDAYVVILDNDAPQNWTAAVTQQPPVSAQVGDTVTVKTTISVDPGGLDLHVTSLSSGAGTSGLDQVQFADATPFTVAAGTSKVVTATARVTGAPGAGGIHLQVSVAGTIGAGSSIKTADSNTIASTEALTAVLSPVPSAVLLSDQITYVLTVDNASDTPAQLIGLPAGLIPPAGTTLANRVDGPTTVPANSISVWTLVVDVNDSDTDGTVITQTPGALSYTMNAVGLASRPVVPAPASVASTVKAPVVVVGPHTLTDVNGGMLLPGDAVDVSVKVSNTGGGNTTATLSDTLSNLQNPTAIKLDGGPCGLCSSAATQVTAPLGALPAGGSHVVTFTATVPASPVGSTASSSATITFAPATTGTSPTATDTSSLTIGSSNVQDWQAAVSQQPPASAQVGDTVTVKATIAVDPGGQNLTVTSLASGAGTSGLDQVVFTDPVPFTVDAGSSRVVTASARVIGFPGAGGIHLQVSVGGTLGAGSSVKTADSSAIASTEALSAALAPVPATVLLTDQITYTLTIANASDTPAQLTGLPAALVAPAGATQVSRTDGPATVPANGTSTWTLVVGPNASDVNGTVITQTPGPFSYSMNAIGLAARPIAPSPSSVASTVSVPAPPPPSPPPPAGGGGGATTTAAGTTTTGAGTGTTGTTGTTTVANTTTTSGGTTVDGTTTTGTTTTATPSQSADLALAVSAPVTGLPRHELVYHFTIRNNGPDRATGVTLSTKLISGGARLISAVPHCVHGGHLVCSLGNLASGKSVKVTIILLARGTAFYQNTAAVSANEPDPQPGNNGLTASTTVAPPNVLGLS